MRAEAQVGYVFVQSGRCLCARPRSLQIHSIKCSEDSFSGCRGRTDGRTDGRTHEVDRYGAATRTGGHMKKRTDMVQLICAFLQLC
jgi:hypothetical protein